MTKTQPLTPQSIQLLEAHLCLDLYVASRAIIGAYRPLLAPHGLTYPQYLVLLALRQYGDSSVKALGERLSLDVGTLSPLLKRLEKLALVSRARLPRDARELRLSLTPAGERLCQTLSAVPQQIACASGLSLADTLALQATLRGLTRQLMDAD